MNASLPDKTSPSKPIVQKAIQEKSKFERWWQNFNMKDYQSELTWTWVQKSLLAAAIIYIFQTPVKVVINTVLVQPVLKFAIQKSILADFLFISLFLYGLLYFIRQIKMTRLITASSVFIHCVGLIIYLVIFRFSPDYDFYHLSLPILSVFTYTDLLLITLALRLSSYKTYNLPLVMEKGGLSLSEDLPSVDAYKDLYGNSGYAKRIAGHINSTTTISSFGIGLMGYWGSGKTDFMLRLKAELLENKSQNLVFEFNPWRIKSDAIIDEFFKALSNELKPFNQSISNDLKEYSRRILQTGKEIHYRLLDALINNWGNDDTLHKKYTDLNKAIGLTGKRIVVLVDDLDRLTGKEIMEVLRIIRNTANFSNVFFVVAMDQKYIVDALKNTKDFANEEEYLKKIFQLTIILPAYKNSLMAGEALKYLVTNDTPKADSDLLKTIIKKLSWDNKDVVNVFYPAVDQRSIFENFIGNVRELKRFCNSFKIVFDILKNEVEISDLFVLELIKNKYLGIYNLLRSRQLLEFNKSITSEFILDEVVFKNLIDYDEKDRDEIREAITFLTSTTSKNQRRFANVQNFYLYFSYQLFNQISFAAFNESLEKATEEMIVTFNEWIDEGKANELENILRELIIFKDQDDLYKMIIVFLGLKKDHDRWLAITQQLLSGNRGNNLKRYFSGEENHYREFVCKLMKDSRVSNLDKSTILNEFIGAFISTSDQKIKVFKNKKEIQDLMVELLKNELDTTKDFHEASMRILYNIYDKVDPKTDRISLYLPALRLMESHLFDKDEHFKAYLTKMIRPAFSPYDDTVVLEPFYDKIFKNQKNFLEKVKEIKFEEPEDSSRQALKDVVCIYSEQYPGGTPFVIEDVRYKKVIKDLMIESGLITYETNFNLEG